MSILLVPLCMLHDVGCLLDSWLTRILFLQYLCNSPNIMDGVRLSLLINAFGTAYSSPALLAGVFVQACSGLATRHQVLSTCDISHVIKSMRHSSAIFVREFKGHTRNYCARKEGEPG